MKEHFNQIIIKRKSSWFFARKLADTGILNKRRAKGRKKLSA